MKTEKTQIEKLTSAAELKFNATKIVALELKKSAESIVISDETTLAMTNQLLSKVKDHEKAIDDKRKALKKPYFEAGKAIDAVAKGVLTPLQEALEIGKGKLKVWNTAQQVILDKQKAEGEKHQVLLNKIVSQIKEKTEACKTVEQCIQLSNSVKAKFPVKETFGSYGEESIRLKDEAMHNLKVRYNQIKKGVEVTEVEEAEVAKAEEVIVATATKSAVRKTWKAEVVDHDKLPVRWLTANMDAINDHLRIHKATLKSGVIIDGVKFYQDETPIIK